MFARLKKFFGLLKETAKEWSAHQAPRLGAALAYYTTFSVAPLIVLILAIAGLWMDPATVRDQLFGQLHGLVGEKGAEAIQSAVTAANEPKSGTWATVLAAVTLVFGATGVFVQLQDALNTLWNVRRKPGGGLWRFIRVRLLSFAMIVGVGFLLLVTLVVNAALSALGKYLSGVIPAQEIVWQCINFVISLGVVTCLFAAVFKVLPDVKVAWHDVWIGSVVTALLFDLGKFGLGLYLGKSTFASAYGAAGSLVIFLVWVYYSSQIVLFGAEFTRLYAIKYGSQVQPARGTEFVATKEVPDSRAGRRAHV